MATRVESALSRLSSLTAYADILTYISACITTSLHYLWKREEACTKPGEDSKVYPKTGIFSHKITQFVIVRMQTQDLRRLMTKVFEI
ncbi:hypothetical protein OCU04_004484 [Sclerotinia nivalis]|uniref:Uncharacterized protein n=1 Tax=Sclerotinia nivalis TaxID=352851 RepID=A0A9X0AQM1_9HELO|nr:hypothetical protein OCU04_004484 [Sclerotinia nivalis]